MDRCVEWPKLLVASDSGKLAIGYHLLQRWQFSPGSQDQNGQLKFSTLSY